MQNPVRDLRQRLESAYFDQSIPADELHAQLNALREARAKTRVELASARTELTEVLTARQEVLLVVAGVLE